MTKGDVDEENNELIYEKNNSVDFINIINLDNIDEEKNETKNNIIKKDNNIINSMSGKKMNKKNVLKNSNELIKIKMHDVKKSNILNDIENKFLYPESIKKINIQKKQGNKKGGKLK